MGSKENVRIANVSFNQEETPEILIAHVFNKNTRKMKGIRVFIHQDSMNYEMLNIANLFYTKLVKYGKDLGQKITNKMLFETYHEIANSYINFHWKGITFDNKRRSLKHYGRVLAHPKPDYVEVKSDTFRLWVRDESIRKQKEIQKDYKKPIRRNVL